MEKSFTHLFVIISRECCEGTIIQALRTTTMRRADSNSKERLTICKCCKVLLLVLMMTIAFLVLQRGKVRRVEWQYNNNYHYCCRATSWENENKMLHWPTSYRQITYGSRSPTPHHYHHLNGLHRTSAVALVERGKEERCINECRWSWLYRKNWPIELNSDHWPFTISNNCYLILCWHITCV